ncbi:MAG: hypothetical protein AAF771_14025 [Pseudomonadota bacterium]
MVGTVLTATGANQISSNAYAAATIIQHAAILALVGLLIFGGARKNGHPTAMIIALLSPAMVIHSGYTNGSLGVFVLIVAALNCLHVRTLPVFCALVCAGLLIHELFLFLLPAQILCFALRKGEDIRLTTLFSRTFILPVTTATITLSFIHLYGAPDVSEEEFRTALTEAMPAAAEQIPGWSGFGLLAAGQIFPVNTSIMTPWIVAMMMVPLAYLLLLIAVLLKQVDPASAIWFIAAGFMPLLISFIGSDYYRWVGMAANAQIFMILAASRTNG